MSRRTRVSIRRPPARRRARPGGAGSGRGRRAARPPTPVKTTRPTRARRRARRGADDLEVLLDEQDRHGLGRLGERIGDLVDDARREALRGLVDEQQPVLVHERPRERDHLLLAARERAGALVAPARRGRGRARRRTRGAGALPLGEAEVLGDRELRRTPRGPRARSRRRAARCGAWGAGRCARRRGGPRPSGR